MRIAVPDLVSPSYFPAIAAVELGCIAERGVAAEITLQFPVTSAVEALRSGEIDALAGSAHALFHGAPDGGGVKLVAALSQYMYWFLVVRKDLGIERGDPLSRLIGLRIGAAPGPVDGLIQMLVDSDVDPDAVVIGPIPGTGGSGVSFGVTAAAALESGAVDGFWANGMGAEVAVRRGVGTVIVDARRGDGPPGSQHYTFAALMVHSRLNTERPKDLHAIVAGLLDAQQRLRRDAGVATEVARRLFPPMETDLTATLIDRDAPFYDPTISDEDLASVVVFAKQRAMTDLDLTRAELVLDLGDGGSE